MSIPDFILSAPFVAAAGVDTVVLGGAGALLLALFGYLFKELRRKDESVWQIIAERDRRLIETTYHRDYWQAVALGLPLPTAPEGLRQLERPHVVADVSEEFDDEDPPDPPRGRRAR